IAVNFGVNRWNGWFFDSLEKRDARQAGLAVMVFPLLVAAAAAGGVFMVWCRETVQVRWREYIVRAQMARWLGAERYHRLGALGVEPANPEYRIADDIRMAIEPLVDLYIGVVSSVLTGITFFAVLWSVGGGWDAPVGATTLHIPAFMVLAALLYGATTSTIALLVGRSLVRKVGRRNEAEARLRFGLSRVRENAPAVARVGAADQERRALGRIYDDVAARWMQVVRTNANLTWITNSHGVLVLVLPLILATPKYLEGGLSLGDVVKLGSAFVQVQIAIGWFADNIKLLAPSFASMRRVVELAEAIDLADAAPRPVPAQGELARFDKVSIRDAAGRPLLVVPELVLRRGERILALGETSSGKSVLSMALAGLWPGLSGTAHLSRDARVVALTQRAFLPEGTIRQILQAHDDVDEAAMTLALRRCGLARLAGSLDETPSLSDGERRRLAFARAALLQPDLVILDDALSGFDAALAAALLETLTQDDRDVAIVLLAQSEPAWVPPGARRYRLRAEGETVALRPAAAPVIPIAMKG
ncbi:MAG: ABC transporter ATP-binding protein/permease, partial [Methylobacteriaceae bacterium]|nr:ABC transporter ATP-binding protein/permease [Methylobacteriaceae bacterium]